MANPFVKGLVDFGKSTTIGTALGGLTGAGLGAAYLLNTDPTEIVNDPAFTAQWNMLSPDEQRELALLNGGEVGAEVGAAIGGAGGALYGLGRLAALRDFSTKKAKAKPKSTSTTKTPKEETTYFNRRSFKTLTQIIEEASNKSNIEIKHPGAFTAWCKRQGFEGVTCECIKKGLASKNPHVRKMANFARNFGHPECK